MDNKFSIGTRVIFYNPYAINPCEVTGHIIDYDINSLNGCYLYNVYFYEWCEIRKLVNESYLSLDISYYRELILESILND